MTALVTRALDFEGNTKLRTEACVFLERYLHTDTLLFW